MGTTYTLACSTLGNTCEWAFRGGSIDEIELRFRDHARCAHQLRELSSELLDRVRQSIRTS
jgi:predicted small metal-binding protein